jgi:hypothetical protein
MINEREGKSWRFIARQRVEKIKRKCCEYRVYTKEWCGFNSENYWNRIILLCIPCISDGKRSLGVCANGSTRVAMTVNVRTWTVLGHWATGPLKTLQVKVKVILEETTKAQSRIEIELYTFFNLGATWGVCDQGQVPAAFFPGKITGTHFKECWGGHQGVSERSAENPAHTGIRSPDRTARSE